MTKFEALRSFYNSVIFNGVSNTVKRISNNTQVSINNGILRVTLRRTEVVGLDLKNSRLCINTGGWNTPTTRRTINEALDAFCIRNYSVNCKNGVFQVNGSPAQRYNEYEL